MRVVDSGSPRSHVLTTILVLASSIALWAGSYPVCAEVDAQAESKPGLAIREFQPVGGGSCAARACHGSTEQRFFESERYKISHTVWVESDPHARATQDLYSPRALVIIKRLGPKWTRPAHEEMRCLACHATVLGADDQAGKLLRPDGVSCESCHGAAKDWLDKHFAPQWKNSSADEKRQSGMLPLRELSDRAEACVGCHIGAPEDRERGIPLRDMNHDMIAAGHPRLSYEFASYLDQIPRHWNEKLTVTDARARAWLVGQVSSAKAACALLESRATRAATEPATARWPEFAEYNCYACHFQLKPELKDRPGGDDRKDVGLPAWGSWITPRLRDLDINSPEFDELREVSRFGSLKLAEIRSQAQHLRALLGPQVMKANTDPLVAGDLIDALVTKHRSGSKSGITDWDDAAQLYLALWALNRPNALGGGPQPVLRGDLDFEKFRKLLLFSVGNDSPAGFEPRSFEKALP